MSKLAKLFAAGIVGGKGAAGLSLPQVASATLLLDLEADTLALSDGALVSAWADQSGNGHNFTQSGSARPAFHTDGNGGYVEFDGVDDYLEGSNFADNLADFAIFVVGSANGSEVLLSKEDAAFTSGYEFNLEQLYIYGGGSSNSTAGAAPSNTFAIINGQIQGRQNTDFFVNGVDQEDPGSTLIASYSVSAPVRLAVYGDLFAEASKMKSVLIYQITDVVNWPTDRAAITTWLADRYGVTL
jgi:hypothetical protein